MYIYRYIHILETSSISFGSTNNYHWLRFTGSIRAKNKGVRFHRTRDFEQ